jgi:hypothetical protein
MEIGIHTFGDLVPDPHTGHRMSAQDRQSGAHRGRHLQRPPRRPAARIGVTPDPTALAAATERHEVFTVH